MKLYGSFMWKQRGWWRVDGANWNDAKKKIESQRTGLTIRNEIFVLLILINLFSAQPNFILFHRNLYLECCDNECEIHTQNFFIFLII